MFAIEVDSEKEKVMRLLKGPQFDRERHGSLYDRGSADSYYHRAPTPHWYRDGTGSLRITELTDAERAEYLEGYNYNEQYGDKKEW
jgi:hypothetical protein